MNNLTDPEQKPLFLFFGFAAEYTLNPLYEYMRNEGDNCVEIDMFTCPDVERALTSLIGKKIVFITSAHLMFDEMNFSHHYSHSGKIISPLQVISTLNPLASIYYPHDLSEPIKNEELPYLHLFDIFLSPLSNLDYLNQYLPVLQVGWIKFNKNTQQITPINFNPLKSVFFPAYQVHANRGVDYFYEKHKPIFDAGIAVKFPYWNGSEKFENFLLERNAIVYPSIYNSIQIMEENNLIFTQALSSTGLEASRLGKKVVYIKDSELDYSDPEIEFSAEKNIIFVDSPAIAACINPDSVPSGHLTLDSFNFEKARNAIWAIYKSKNFNLDACA